MAGREAAPLDPSRNAWGAAGRSNAGAVIRTLLIANRGEIACRIIRTARRMGIETVAVHSDADADADALHVRLADRAVRIGADQPAQSYLDGAAIIDAARRMGADAVHPGYGFLSENAGFARDCAGAGLVFIGPPADAIHAMGDKARARRIMVLARVPVVPGYDDGDQGDEVMRAAAQGIGFPLLVKAAAGGGGRGMRRVDEIEHLSEALASARREAESAFGDGALLLEKLVSDARHIEFQIFADRHGNCIHLGERDCSAQRRHQKIVEEAPSPFVGAALRERMGRDAVLAARSVGYQGAGTVEFIVGEDGGYHFLEMNTRLQVEHPVTEMVTGLDLVEWQLRIAMGETLPLAQEEVPFAGHSIEARLCAEDPFEAFRPQTGRVIRWRPAEIVGARVDNGIAEGSEVTPNYDPMLAKLIVRGADRDDALRRLDAALDDCALAGIRTNRTFLKRLVACDAFRAGRMTTGLVDRWIASADPILDAAVATGMDFALAGFALATAGGGGWFRSSGVALCPMTLECGDLKCEVTIGFERGRFAGATVDGEPVDLRNPLRQGDWIEFRSDDRTGRALAVMAGNKLWLDRDANSFRFSEPDPLAARRDAGDPSRIVAPVSGLMRQMSVAVGDRVRAGQTVAVIEAMKMENALVARADGIVASVACAAGDQARAGDVVIVLDVHPA